MILEVLCFKGMKIKGQNGYRKFIVKFEMRAALKILGCLSQSE